MVKRMRDGTVELAVGGGHTPPGRPGQRTNKNIVWFRVTGSGGSDRDWAESGHRTWHKAVEALELAETVGEWLELEAAAGR